MSIRIVTDTAADMSAEFRSKLNVELIELPVTFDGDTAPCQDAKLFWQNLLNGKIPHTSQPNPETIRNLFDSVQACDSLIYVCLSSKLSATCENAAAIAAEKGADNIFVVDSLNATFGEGMLVQYACTLRDKGLDAPQIAKELDNFKTRIRVYACIDTLKYLARGGRISHSAAAIGNVLNIKPLIEVTGGEVVPYGKTLGCHLAMRKLLDRVNADGIDWDFAPVPIYAYDSDNCLSFVRHANKYGLAFDKNLVTPIGSTIGTHIGPHAFGIVFVTL